MDYAQPPLRGATSLNVDDPRPPVGTGSAGSDLFSPPVWRGGSAQVPVASRSSPFPRGAGILGIICMKAGKADPARITRGAKFPAGDSPVGQNNDADSSGL